jgi:hypothetical protein
MLYPETSVKDCHSTLRNIPEERRCEKFISFNNNIYMFRLKELSDSSVVETEGGLSLGSENC